MLVLCHNNYELIGITGLVVSRWLSVFRTDPSHAIAHDERYLDPKGSNLMKEVADRKVVFIFEVHAPEKSQSASQLI